MKDCVEQSDALRARTVVSSLEIVLSAPAPAAVRDDDLIERLRNGEQAAIAETYTRHHAAVRGFARRLVGDDAAAEDIVHDTFVALPRAIRRFRGDSALRTFLIGVAINHARRHTRAAARRRAAYGTIDATAAGDGRADAEQRVLLAQLCAALDALPMDQRVAFVLCEIERRTSSEVAAIVGVPEGTVRTRVHHARRKLRIAMGEAP
jgi:RNA polymerase sigma-70 factor (ECF subfamily)